jgi:hypothetical protein
LKRGSMEIRCSVARARKVEWVSERSMCSLCDVGEVRVVNVGSGFAGVDSRFLTCSSAFARRQRGHSGGFRMGITSRDWLSSMAGAADDTLTLVDRVFLTVFWILVDAAFFGFRT